MGDTLNIIDAVRKQRFLDKDYIKITSIEELIKGFITSEDNTKYFLDNKEYIIGLLNKYNFDINNFYIANPKDSTRALWECTIVYFDKFIIGANFFFISTMEDLEQRLSTIKKMLNHAPDTILNYSAGNLRLDNFLRNYKRLKKETLLEQFIYVYSSIDYGHKELANIFSELLTKGNYKKEDFENMENEVEFFDDDNIYIYRGMHDESLDIEKAFSWTTSLDKAIWFASRRGYDGEVYRAIIDINDIYYINHKRGEDEVLVRYSDLMDIEEVLY